MPIGTCALPSKLGGEDISSVAPGSVTAKDAFPSASEGDATASVDARASFALFRAI